jgi:cellulose biosynthesis protein BcsQ
MNNTAKAICLISDKGGISKSETTYNLGYALALQNKKVLLVGADVKTDLNIRSNADSQTDFIQNYLKSGVISRPEHLDRKKTKDKLFILPRNERFIDAEIKQDTFKNIIDNFTKEFDYILIDTTANIGQAGLDCLYSSDIALIVTDHDIASYDGVHQLVSIINESVKDIDYYIIHAKAKNTKGSKEYKKLLEEVFIDKVIGQITYSEVYYNCREHFVSVFQRPKTIGYKALVKARAEHNLLANKIIKL